MTRTQSQIQIRLNRPTLIIAAVAGILTNTALWFFGDVVLASHSILQIVILAVATIALNGIRTSYLSTRWLACIASLGVFTLCIWWIAHLTDEGHRQPLEVWHVVGAVYVIALLVVASRLRLR